MIKKYVSKLLAVIVAFAMVFGAFLAPIGQSFSVYADTPEDVAETSEESAESEAPEGEEATGSGESLSGESISSAEEGQEVKETPEETPVETPVEEAVSDASDSEPAEDVATDGEKTTEEVEENAAEGEEASEVIETVEKEPITGVPVVEATEETAGDESGTEAQNAAEGIEGAPQPVIVTEEVVTAEETIKKDPLMAVAKDDIQSWEDLKTAISEATAGDTLTITKDLYADSTITIDKNITIKGKDGQTIYQKKRDKYDTMFKVTGGTLTLDEKLTLSGKTADCSGGGSSTTHTLDEFETKWENIVLKAGDGYLRYAGSQLMRTDNIDQATEFGVETVENSGVVEKTYITPKLRYSANDSMVYAGSQSANPIEIEELKNGGASAPSAIEHGKDYVLFDSLDSVWLTGPTTEPSGQYYIIFGTATDATEGTTYKAQAKTIYWTVPGYPETSDKKTAQDNLDAYNASQGQGCDGADCPGADTYTNTTFPGGTSIDAPKGFFVQVEGGKAVLNGATLENFITSRDKGTSPKYVAPVAVIGASSSFDIAAGTIQNNIVGYVVQDSKANESADKIKAYVKGGAPNAQRKPNSVRRKKQAGIDGDDPGSGIMGTSGAVIYTGGAKGDVTGGEIKFNRADTGGIFVTGNGTQVNLKEGTDINNNVGVQFGGGTTVEDGGFIAMTGGEISQNVAWFGGGAVFATENGIKWLLGQKGMGDRKDGWFTMEGGKMDSNTAFTRGGAILTDSDGVALKKGVLSNNMSRMLGGAVYVMGDHPDFTYTMYIEKGYVHENKAVSAGYKGTVATTATRPGYDKVANMKLSKKLTAPNGCNPPAALFAGDMEVNSDDLVDGYPNNQTMSTDGTGGGIWLCSYGNTTIDLSSASQFYINENTATGSLRNNPISAPGEGGDDFHKDTKNNGSLVVTGITEADQWYDQNQGANGEIYTSPTGEPGVKDTGLRNLINKGNAAPDDYNKETYGSTTGVDVYGNLSRRGGGLAADGSFVFGTFQDTADIYAEMSIKKSWAAGLTDKPVAIKVFVEENGEKIEVATVPLTGEAKASSELDTIFDDGKDEAGNYNGRFILPTYVEKRNNEGEFVEMVQVFDITADGKDIQLNKVEDLAALADAIDKGKDVKLSSAGRKIVFEEYIIEYDNNNELILKETDEFELSPGSVSLDEQEATIKSIIQKQTNGDETRVITASFSELAFSADLTNDHEAEIDKYVNKAVHKNISVDEEFEYDIIAYVKHNTDKLIIEDELVKDLEFVSTEANVKVVSLEENNHKPAKDINNTAIEGNEDASVVEAGSPIDASKRKVTIDPDTNKLEVVIENKLNEVKDGSGTVIGYENAATDQNLKDLWGKWVKVTFKARIKQELQDRINDGENAADVLKYETITPEDQYKPGNSIYEGGEKRPEPNKGNDPVKSDETHDGIENTASYKLEVKNEGKWKDESNTVTVKPDEPEVEKYVNQAVHKDIAVDEVFTYDIIGYITEDADKVVFEDILTSDLELIKVNDIKVASLDKNNHKPFNDISGSPIDDNSDASVAEDGTDIKTLAGVKVEAEDHGSKLVVTIDDEVEVNDEGTEISRKHHTVEGLRKKYVKVTFQAQIKESIQDEIKAGTMSVKDLSSVKILKDENKPVLSDEDHEGIANTANMKIDVDGDGKYELESNTVTVKPDGPEVEKYVNQAVHKDITVDEVFTYDIIGYITEDADKVVFEDELTSDLELIKVDEIKVVSLDKNNHKPFNDISGSPIDDNSDASVAEDGKDIKSLEGVKVEAEDHGSKLVVIIDDDVKVNDEGTEISRTYHTVEGLRKKYVKVTFQAQIKESIQAEIKAGTKSVEDLSSVKVSKDENKPVLSDEDHEGIVNTANMKIEVDGKGKYELESNTVTVKPEEPGKPEEPEIEKFVNEAVHKDITLDEEFTYDIVAYITKDAESVRITDTLNDTLDFVSGTPDVGVVDLGEANNHKVTNDISAKQVNSDATVAKSVEGFIDGSEVEISGKTLIVDIPDATAVRGHWVRIRFVAKLADGVNAATAEKAFDTVKASEVYKDSLSNGDRKEPNVGNEPVVSDEDHTGIPNTASYEIKVGNEVKYEDTSNTVTVKPESESVDIPVHKVWDEDGGEAKRPESITVKLLANGEDTSKTITISGTNDNDWDGAFTDLAKYDENGEEIQYTVEEVAVDYYYYDTEWLDETYVVTNHSRPWIPKTPVTPGNVGEITVQKTVSGNAEKNKAYDIVVKFTYTDGTTYTHELSLKPTDKPFLFDYVPADTKVEISEKTTGYKMTCKVDGTDATNFNVKVDGKHKVVINNHVEPKTPEKPKDIERPKTMTGDQTHIIPWIALLVLSVLLTGAMAYRRKESRK